MMKVDMFEIVGSWKGLVKFITYSFGMLTFLRMACSKLVVITVDLG